MQDTLVECDSGVVLTSSGNVLELQENYVQFSGLRLSVTKGKLMI